MRLFLPFRLSFHLAILGCAAVLATAQAPPKPRFQMWHQQAHPASGQSLEGDAPLAAGSLQKPFVAKAWAASHGTRTPPRFSCTSASGCWRPSGHGELGLAKALSVSCNVYFLQLARDTPLRQLRETLSQEGFQGLPSTPEAAIGLFGGSPVVIRPSQLIQAYGRLIHEPWTQGEGVRKLVLSGLREGARSGTAQALGRRGCWAKTGTTPPPSGEPTRTRGLVLMVDDEGRGTLAELDPGTGREAAAELGRRLRQGDQGDHGHQAAANAFPPTAQERADRVVVRLFDLLPARAWRARNLGATPISAGSGFLGAGATLALKPGDALGPGLLEVEVPGTGLVRRLEGRLAVLRDGEGRPRLTAILSPREYMSGVLLAELPQGSAELRLALGAAALRFLARGPRHTEADVCDSTHCAWFVGRGPRVVWSTPLRAVPSAARSAARREGPHSLPEAALPEASEWEAMVALSRKPGPSLWSSHCGGAPLSAHAVWGNGQREVSPCPRHPTPTPPWQRIWKQADLAKAFGGPVDRMEIQHPDGVWTLVLHGPGGSQTHPYDQAHRRLAKVLGWDALPSPADAIHPHPQGFRAQGRGQGHRVGLCLGE